MKQVALLQMPWGVLDRGTLPLGLLKEILKRGQIPARVYYLNLKFARYIREDVYRIISSSFFLIGDWLFAQHLFRDMTDVRHETGFDSLIDGLCAKGGMNRQLAEQLIHMKSELNNIIEVVIPKFMDECMDSLPWDQISIAGFSCKVGAQLSSLALARRVKEQYPHIKIVFGGPNVFDKMGEETIRSFEWVDYVMDSESEKTIVELFGNIIEEKSVDTIPGVLLRRDGRIIINKPGGLTDNLDSLPIPDYSEYFEELENSGLIGKVGKIVIPYESTRGCWWGENEPCRFCAVNNGKNKYRSKSPDKILQEILTHIEKYNIKNFYAADSILNMDFFNSLIPELAERKLGLSIYHDVKPRLNRKQINLLYEAGIKILLTGIESLDNELLGLMHKGTTALENIQMLKLCSEMSMEVLWSMLYGIPGEDPACYSRIMEKIPKISHFNPPGSIVKITLDRFSPYFNAPEKYGLKNVKANILYEYIYPDKRINLDDIAYTFEYEYEDSGRGIELYEKMLADMVMKWAKVFYTNRSKCEYTVAGNDMEITDSRPGILRDRMENIRKYVFSGAKKDIYAYCNEIKKFDDILEHVNKGLEVKLGQDDLKKLLDGFIKDQLMLEEDSRYLSLAVARHSELV